MHRPNFFLVGAPKSGTTAMCDYLRGHPSVFIPELKEPEFFLDRPPDHPHYISLSDYLGLFEETTTRHSAIGEGTVWYLSSANALRSIRSFHPGAKIIVMLRSPVDMALSLHSHLVMHFYEDVKDFERAWRLQDRRKKGQEIPRGCVDPWMLQYRQVARLGTQLEQLLQIFPQGQVKLIIYDDFAADTKGAYEGVLSFLGLPSDDRTLFPRVNVRRKNRAEWLSRVMYRPPSWLATLHGAAKRILGLKRTGIKEWFTTPVPKSQPVRDEFRRELVAYFCDEVAKVAEITGRNLEHWLE